MISDTASNSTGRHTFPLSSSYSTDSSGTGTSSSTGRGAPNSEATSDEQPDLGAFTTVLRAWNHFQPAPRVPIGLSSGSSMSVASTGSGTRITTIQDRDSRPEYSYSDAGQSSISSFTHPHLSSAAVSVTDDGAAEDRQTTVWDHRPIWSSYLRSDSAISKPDSPSDSESVPRTVEIASDVENDTRSIPDSLDSHSDSDSHIYSQSHNPIPVSIQQPFTLVPQALSSLSSLDLNDSFSSSQFSQRTLRRSNFPVQNDFSAAGSGPSRMNSQSGSPSYYNRHQQEPATRHSYLTSQFQDTEAAVRSLLEEASRSRHHGIVNDVSSISSSSRGRPTPESAYTRGSDQGSPYSHSLQTQASGYSGTPTSTAASEVVLAPHAYPQYQRQSSNLRNYSPRVEQEPFSPLPTPTDASETFPYDDDRRKEEHDYDVRTPTRTIVAGSRSQTYDGAHPYPHPLVGLHVLPTTLPGNGPSGPAFESRRGSGHTETRVQKEIAPAKEEDTDNESIKYRRRPASDATTVSEQIVLSPPFPPAQSKADYATPDSSTSVTVTVASRDGNPPPPSNYSQPSTTIGYDQPSTTIGYNPTAAELEHPTLGALDEALSFIALERARMAANKKPVYEIAAGDLSSEGEGHGARRVQVESGGSGGRSKPTIAGSVNMDEDNTGTSPNAVTTMAGAGSSSGKRKRRRKKAAAAAALSQSLTNNNESQVAVTGLDQHVRAAGSSRMSKSSSTSTVTGGSSSGTGSGLGPGRPLLLAPKVDVAPTPLKASIVEVNAGVEEGEWEDEEEQELLRTPKALPRFKSLSKPSVKELPKVTKDKSSKEKEKIKPGGITILARPKAAPTSSISDVSVTSVTQQQKMKLRTRPVVEADGEDDEWEGVDSGSSKERQGNAGGQPKAVEEKKEVDKGGFSLAGKQGRRVGRREREKEKRRLDALLGIPSIADQGAVTTSDDNDDSAADVYDDDPEDEISPNLARKWKQAADTERTADLYSSEGGEILSAGLRAWHQQRRSRTLGPSSLGSELGFEAPGVGTGSGSRTPRPADNARIDELEAEESLVLDDAPLPPAMNGTGTSVTGHKKKKRSRRARTLLARSKSYPNLRAAAELGTESLKRRLGFLGSGGSAGSGAGPNGLDLEADLYLDQNKRNRLYILAHKLLTAFPEQKRDLKRIILKLEQSTLNGATSSSSSTKKKGHKRSTSSGGYTSGGYGSGAGIGIGTIPSMASFSNPDYIDYDEPQDPAEFDVQGPAHTPGASIVHVFIDHSNILIGLLNFLRRHPPPQSTVDEYITSRTRLTSHSTPALIDVEVDGEISIPSHNADNPRTRNGSKPIPIPGKGKGKMPVVETPTPSAEEYPIPLPSFATAKSKGTPKRHSNPQASLVALSKSLPSESFLSQGQAGAGDERVLDSNEEGSRSDGRLKKPLPPKFPRHIWHAALVLILERGRPVSRRVVVTSSPLHQPMEKIMSLGYEVRVFIRVPDLGDGMDRREKENRFSNGNNSGSGAGKSNASQTSHSKSGGAFGTSSSPGGKGFVYGAVSAAGNGVGSPSGSLAGTPNAGVGTPAKKGHARHLSGYTSNESGSGSNRDNKGIGGPSPGTPAKVRYREQGVDELLQLKLHQALADVDNVPKGSTIVLATGDGNVGQFNEDGFLGPVRLALRKGWKVELYAWEDGLSKSWRREFGEGSEYGKKGLFRIIPLEQFGTSLVEAAGW